MTEIHEPTDTLRAFRRDPDGSWHCLEATELATPGGTLAIRPGQVFVFGDPVGGVDVAEYLEQLGAQFGS